MTVSTSTQPGAHRAATRRSNGRKFGQLLRLEPIHKSYPGVPCPTCDIVRRFELHGEAALTEKELKKLNKARNHINIVRIQRANYRRDRLELKPGEVLIVQDFTKHDKDKDTTTQQDHIVVIYQKLPSGVEVFDMEHFVAADGVKNDCYFSMHVWYLLQSDSRIQDADKLLVWSDNGPKHFKLTSYLHFMSLWAEANRKKLSLRFNAPYHGACVADTAAAHAKQATKRYIASSRDNMKDPYALVSVIDVLAHHNARLVDLKKTNKKLTAKTWAGLTKYYHWEPVKGGAMNAYVTTDDYRVDAVAKTYQIPRDVNIPYRLEEGKLGLVPHFPE